MVFQIKLALLLPAATVAALAGGASSLRVKRPVFLAVHRTVRNQLRTTGVLAGLLTFLRHKVHLRIQKAASDDSMAALVLFFAMIQYSIP